MKKLKRQWYNKHINEDNSPRCHYFLIYRNEPKLSRSGSMKCYSLEAAIECATRLGWKTIKGVGKHQAVHYTNGVFNESQC